MVAGYLSTDIIVIVVLVVVLGLLRNNIII
jgi:hypothetical protein